MQYILTALLCLLLFSACLDDPTDIYGRWQVEQMFEQGETSDLDLNGVYFHFSPTGTYEYQGNLKYREAGYYRIERKLLYTTDTLNEERIEKAVKITHLSPDSLSFLMNAQGNEQILILSKSQQ